MSLEFRPGQYILGLWFVRERDNVPIKDRFDWLAMVWKDTTDGPWLCRYRTCQHVSEGLLKDGAPPDKRSWYQAEIDGSLSDDMMIEQMETMAMQIADFNDVPMASVHVQGDFEHALTLLQTQPWFHVSRSS